MCMYLFFLFSYFYNNNNNNNKINKINLGIDERHIFYKSNHEEIYTILKIYETINKIYFLESNNVSIDDKLYEINEKNLPSAYKPFNGGLYNDWNFDFPIE